jgi:hypothetical protein
MGERARPNVHWHRSMLPRDPASLPQSLFSVPLNHSEDNLLAAAQSAPVPPAPVQRVPSISSYRVPVPYAGVGVHDSDTRVENRRSTGALSEHLQIHDAPPPRLPVRSPSRALAVYVNANNPRLSMSLSRASSPSIYPPSPHRSDADSVYPEEAVASLPPKRETPPGWLTRGLSYGTDRVDETPESQGAHIDPRMGSDSSASSSSRAHYSPWESPASETSTAHTSIQDGNAHNRKVVPPRASPAALFMHHKSGAWLRRDS